MFLLVVRTKRRSQNKHAHKTASAYLHLLVPPLAKMITLDLPGPWKSRPLAEVPFESKIKIRKDVLVVRVPREDQGPYFQQRTPKKGSTWLTLGLGSKDSQILADKWIWISSTQPQQAKMGTMCPNNNHVNSKSKLAIRDETWWVVMSCWLSEESKHNKQKRCRQKDTHPFSDSANWWFGR